MYINLSLAYHKTINCTIILYTTPRLLWLTKWFKFIVSRPHNWDNQTNKNIYLFVTGPSTWVSKFPMAAGSRQSPVNIETDKVESDHEALSSKPLRWKYPATASRKLVNPGYCWRMDTDGEGTCKFIFQKPFHFSNFKLDQNPNWIWNDWNCTTKIFIWKNIISW